MGDKRHGEQTARVELLDAFGAVLADGYLTPRDVPGIDGLTPSAAEQFTQQVRDQRIALAATEAYSGPALSIKVY